MGRILTGVSPVLIVLSQPLVQALLKLLKIIVDLLSEVTRQRMRSSVILSPDCPPTKPMPWHRNSLGLPSCSHSILLKCNGMMVPSLERIASPKNMSRCTPFSNFRSCQIRWAVSPVSHLLTIMSLNESHWLFLPDGRPEGRKIKSSKDHLDPAAGMAGFEPSGSSEPGVTKAGFDSTRCGGF